jgi:hypothetical protein
MGLGIVVLLRLVVHEVDTAVHTTVPPGWRWAVMVGDGPHDDMSRCANAGWQPNLSGAELEGEMVAVAAVKALRMSGLDVRYEMTRLDYDPIPAEGDTIAIGG